MSVETPCAIALYLQALEKDPGFALAAAAWPTRMSTCISSRADIAILYIYILTVLALRLFVQPAFRSAERLLRGKEL